MERPVFHVVEHNPYTPQPFVMTEVAISLRDAIRAAGHACEHVVNRVDPGAFSIVLGGSPALAARWPGMDRARCAIFNLEQLGSTSNIAGPDYRRWLADWLVLDYHAGNIEVLRAENGPAQQALELPLVPSDSLGLPPPPEKTVDVLFYGTLSERRQVVIDQLQAMGLTVEVVAGAYGIELAPAVQRARLVLHVHFYSTSLFPVARVLQPAVRGVPIVSEDSVFSPLNDWSPSGILFAPYDGLAAACAALLRDPAGQRERAERTRAFAARIDFARPFEAVARAMRERAAQAALPDAERLLTDAEIEALLAEEGAELPPEGHVAVPPVKMVERQPGKGPYGAWIVVVLLVFSFYTIWLSMKR